MIARALGPGERALGALVYTIWSGHPAAPETWWFISPDGSVLAARVVGEVDPAVRGSFEALDGHRLDDCGAKPAAPSPAGCACQVLAVLDAHDDGS